MVRTKLLLFLLFIFSYTTVYSINSNRLIHLNNLTVDTQQVFFKDGQLYLEGFDGKGFINIYSIIGNKIFASEVFNLGLNKKLSIDLKPGNMFIIQVHLNNKIKTFKIIA